jgi:transposase-like protein/IS1 family transposase
MWLFPAEIKRRKAMTCTKCQHQVCKKFGYFGKRRIQRWRCTSCQSTFCEPHDKLTRDTMTANPDAAERALHCLLEGCSIRSAERLTGLNRNTIMRLLLVAGELSARLMDGRMRELNSRYLQVDEIWCYVGKKRRNVRSGDSPEFGDQWIYVAIDAETKLVPSFRIGKRVRPDTWAFLWDLHHRIANRVQLTTDGLNHYTVSVPECFGTDVDFAQLTKMFGDYGQLDSPDARYSRRASRGLYPKPDRAIPIPDI